MARRISITSYTAQRVKELETVVKSMEGRVPGTELAYAETAAGSTGTTVAPTLTNLPALTLTVVGQGRPVDVEWFSPLAYHSVANGGVLLAIVMFKDGVNQGYRQSLYTYTPKTDGTASGAYLKVREVLAQGSTYVFSFNAGAVTAGTWAVGASGGTRKMFTSAVSR